MSWALAQPYLVDPNGLISNGKNSLSDTKDFISHSIYVKYGPVAKLSKYLCAQKISYPTHKIYIF